MNNIIEKEKEEMREKRGKTDKIEEKRGEERIEIDKIEEKRGEEREREAKKRVLEEIEREKIMGEIVRRAVKVFRRNGVVEKLKNGKAEVFVSGILMNQIGGVLGKYESIDPVFASEWKEDEGSKEEIKFFVGEKIEKVWKELEWKEWMKEAANKIQKLRESINEEKLPKISKKISEDKAYMIIKCKRENENDKDIKLAYDLYKKLVNDLCRNGHVKNSEEMGEDEEYGLSLIFTLVLRYLHVLKSGNHQLGITYYKQLNDIQPVEAELFASPLNHTLDKYCSLFYDTDSPFGSLGPVFNHIDNLSPNKLYFANPPYQHSIMNLLASSIISLLKRIETTIILTIPVWDYEGLLKVGNSKTASLYKDQDYPILSLLQSSPFLVSKLIFSRENHVYFDHVNRVFLPASATYTLIVSSSPSFDHSSFNSLIPSLISHFDSSYFNSPLLNSSYISSFNSLSKPVTRSHSYHNSYSNNSSKYKSKHNSSRYSSQ